QIADQVPTPSPKPPPSPSPLRSAVPARHPYSSAHDESPLASARFHLGVRAPPIFITARPGAPFLPRVEPCDPHHPHRDRRIHSRFLRGIPSGRSEQRDHHQNAVHQTNQDSFFREPGHLLSFPSIG